VESKAETTHDGFAIPDAKPQMPSEIPTKRQQFPQQMDQSFQNMHQKTYMHMQSYMDKKKRFRRTANQIERNFYCSCGKAYGSEGSLNQHKKLKTHA
jgi:hypothetical protein